MHWKTSKLKDICATFADGDWIESKDQSPEGIRLLQTGNIGEAVFKERNEKARYISAATFDRLKCTEVLPQDCLISRLPDPVGRACVVPSINEKMITGVDCTIVRFKPEVSSRWFVYYSLSQAYYEQVKNSVGGATRQRISRTNLGDVLIPVPPIAEQKRVLAVLDKACGAISKAKANAEKNLANARELFSSYLQELFLNPGPDWENAKIGEIADIEYGFTDNAKSIGPYRYIRITDIDRYGCLEKGNKVFVASSDDAKKFLLKEGDLLMARTGATFGKVLLYEDLEKSVFASYLIRIVFKTDFVNKLYWYFSKSKAYWDQANKLASGSAQPQFNGNALKEIILSFPKSLKEQKETVAKLDGMYSEAIRLESVYQRKIQVLEELKKAVLNKAFRGELVGANS